MRKRLWFMAAAGILFLLTACGSIAEAAGTRGTVGGSRSTGGPETVKAAETGKTAQTEKAAETAGENRNRAEDPGDSQEHILIAYFTWAENTHVEHPESVDVDATTSASVLLPGNTARLAGWIQEEVGGDLFSIAVTELYSSDYDECLDRASEELSQKARPALAGHVEHMEQYDTIFLGFPDWWSSCPMAVFAFLEEYDFSGKTVIPFCAHGTGGVGRSIRDIRSAVPEAVLLKEIGVYRQDMETARESVRGWLKEIGIGR